MVARVSESATIEWEQVISHKECFMDKQNTTWISTTPRTGSMWTFNVVREIINYSKTENK